MKTPDMDINEWRAAIDRHDDEVLALIKSRLALSEQVGKSKTRGGLAWRPAREAQLFARLVGRASATLNPHSVERLWSTVIAQSLQAQGPAFLLVSRSDAALPSLARTFFGLLPMHMVDDDAEAINRCQTEEGGIAIVPAPGAHNAWWVQLANMNEKDAPAPAVLAAMPRFSRDTPPSAYAIAMAPRECSGDDHEWYVAKTSMDDMTHGAVLARNHSVCLIEFDGKAAPKDRAGFCQIGRFAKPL